MDAVFALAGACAPGCTSAITAMSLPMLGITGIIAAVGLSIYQTKSPELPASHDSTSIAKPNGTKDFF